MLAETVDAPLIDWWKWNASLSPLTYSRLTTACLLEGHAVKGQLHMIKC